MSNLGIEPGAVIGGDFRVERHLASGAMGSVYIVDQLSTGKQRALKVMGLDLAGNERARERFVLEARVGSQVDSDHVVEVVTAGIDEGLGAPYMVMELLKGEELSDRIERQGALPLAEVTEILKQAGHALEKAHGQGIVHRDLKPENLFIAESRREGVPFTVKILDFGIAKLVAERTTDGTQPVGTPLFMAPEQTDRRGLIAPTTDVWPLGLITFRLLTGKNYWLGVEAPMSQLLREVVMEPIVPASERAAELGVSDRLPAGFDAWFARCVDRDPERRFQEAGACVRAFEQLGEALDDDAPTLVARPSDHPGASSVEAAPTVGASQAQLAALQTVGASQAMQEPLPAGGGALAAESSASFAGGGSNAGTELTAATPAEAAPWRGRLIMLAALLGAAAGVGVYLMRRDEAKTEATPPVTSATATAAPPPASPTCPEGMAKIEGGHMFMGSTDEDLSDDVRPPHKVEVSSYCIDLREVTTADYQQCVSDGQCLRAPTSVSFEGLSEDAEPHFSSLCNAGRKDRGDHPINCVTWNMADNYCGTEGGRLEEGGARLPTEAEWEFAARGSGQRIYPWGDQPPGPERLNAAGDEFVAWRKAHDLDVYGQMYEGDDGFPATAPVGTFEAGASSAGALDMAGNVLEWTSDWYGPYSDEEQQDPTGPKDGTERAVRGGAFNAFKPAWAKPAYRWKTEPDTRSHGVGFRCAHDL